MTADTLRVRLGVLRRVATVLFGVALVVGIAIALRDADWAAVRDLTGAGELGLLGLALLVNSVGLVLGMLSWRHLLAGLGSPVGVWTAARIFFVGMITKFVPGRFWALIANIRMGRTAGVTPARMATVYVLNIAVMSLTGLTVGLIAAPSVLGGRGGWLLLAALPVLACAVRPELANRWAAALARLLRRPAPAPAGHRDLRYAIAAQAVSWLVAGLQFWLVAVAAGAPPAASFPVCVGAFGLAAVVGSFVVFVPDGIGVREGILMVALTGLLPLPTAGAVVLVSRLICTVSEIASAGVALLAAELIRRRARPPAGAEPAGAELPAGV
ncbi:lysylphosphatidylglycerol synthase domain-containing protein [Micromonospora sp. WMMD1102]|uniref:lysylphosphatidylglycerol synthase domain-containing protein n=1 Tax=Micromonospora sp. WMMD1102 TaxID=3016105 RepID=UPI0024156D63|nr:lysylphosphatidylglycerol synthase domain-containing protein [Micromonospora sp. WMMD1102]MDG4784835.1 lysylphosphatidylglycerol synthase domain-containing protein [Micromonospora sp. WMMD1102]